MGRGLTFCSTLTSLALRAKIMEMVEKRQTEEMSQAADRLVKAVDDFTRQIERMHLPEPPSEEEADRVGNDAVRETRREALGAGGFLRGPLTYEEIREWEKSREERRKREGYRPI